jgi:hypothetical protein
MHQMAEQGSLDFTKDSPSSKVSADQGLESALTLSRGTDPSSREAATAAFDEAEKLAIRCDDPKTQMRVYEASGNFHCVRRAFGVAQKKYEIALRSAELFGVTSDEGIEDVERLRFKLTKLGNAHAPDFKNLEEAAQSFHSYEQRNLAWASYQEDKINPGERLAARGLGSKEDFRTRLDAAKSIPTNDEDEEFRW